MAETYCRACGTAESERQAALKAGKVNCCPERSVNEVVEVRHGVPAATGTAWNSRAGEKA